MNLRIVGKATDAARAALRNRRVDRRIKHLQKWDDPVTPDPELHTGDNDLPLPPMREREFETNPPHDHQLPLTPKVYSGHVWVTEEDLHNPEAMALHLELVLGSLENRAKQGGYDFDRSKVIYQLTAEMVVTQ